MRDTILDILTDRKKNYPFFCIVVHFFLIVRANTNINYIFNLAIWKDSEKYDTWNYVMFH